jgi:hypothetical protein
VFLLLGGVLTLTSCRDLERFDTKGNAAYCGDLVSGPTFHDGFVATGVEPPSIRVKLTLDTSQLNSFSENKTALLGTLTSDDATRGLCSDGGQPLFASAPLRGIPQVYHDSISALTFGEGHDEDVFAWVDSTCQGTMLSVVSLLRSGGVELRLFKPAPLPPLDAGPEQRPGFALFSLKKQREGCDL